MTKLKALPLIAYILVILIVLVNMTQDDYIVVENRYKSEFPLLSLTSIIDRTYQDGVEHYFGDQIIAEEKFIEVKSQYEIKIGNSTIRNSVLIGDNMFFSKTTLNDINGKLLSDSELSGTIDNLEQISKYYEELGYEFYLAIGPNKASIYGDKLPGLELASQRVVHQVQNELKESSMVNMIDLTNVLESVKDSESENLYFSYDSHWNYIGGLIAARELINTVYPEQDLDYELYRSNLELTKAKNTDLANIIGVGDLYYDTTYVPLEEVNYYKDFMDFSNDSDEELIVIRDSFFDSVAPVFEELDMSRKYVAFLSNYKEGYTPSKSKGKVIMLVVERNIYPSIRGAYDTIFEVE